ncbi:MAG: nucleotidyltransferase family protein [Phycisphaerales bacterium]|nr:nucleotidyltransferase family protein [Phycisphaerales bacterium]
MVRINERVEVSPEGLSELCRRWGIRRLALFGSVLRDDFRTDSDIDVLVDFLPGRTPGFFTLFDIQQELSGLLNARNIDLRTPEDLSRHIRDRVVSEAHTLYGA